MKSKRGLYLMVSFVLALVLSVSVYMYLGAIEKKSENVKTYDIIVASMEIPPYTKITKDMVQQVKVLQVPADATSYFNKSEEVVGMYSADKILKGEQFFKSRILADARDYLSLSLTGNNRAMSVTATPETGVTKMIKPGDYIDIVIYLPELKENEKIVRPDISKMIMQKLLVLAVDQATTDDGSIKTADSVATEAQTEDSGISQYFLTLSVPVFDVEKLALAEDIGNLEFVLRPKDDEYIYPTEGAIWQELLLDESKRMKDVNPSYQIKPDKRTSAGYDYDKYIYYVVKKGDTLRKLAGIYLKDENKYTVLQDINNIKDPNFILPGTGIKVPVVQ